MAGYPLTKSRGKPQANRRNGLRAIPGSARVVKDTFKTRDGIQVDYEDTGGPGPVLFFIYGLGCSIGHWKYPRAFFASENPDSGPHRQVWLEFRGQGKSDPPPGGQRLTMDMIVGDIGELCDLLGIKKATFLGQSMGGTLALKVAATRRDLAAGLVLLGSPGGDPTRRLPLKPILPLAWSSLIALNKLSPVPLRAVYEASRIARTLNPMPASWLRIPLRELIRHTGFNPLLARTKDIEEYIEHLFQVRSDLFFDLAADLTRFDVSKVDPPIDCPTLVLAGAADRVIPLAEAKRLAKLLPNARLEIIEHGGHCPHFDDPATVNRLIDRFLQEHQL